MPPPTEQTLLTRYLLPPSSLPTILPYNTFLSLLPSHLRTNNPNSAIIKRLYRDLQFQRSIDIDSVRHNIALECQRSAVLRGRLREEIREELGEKSHAVGKRQSSIGKGGSERKRKRDDEDEDSEASSGDDDDDDEQQTTQPPVTQPIPQDPLHSPLETHLDLLFSGPRGLSHSTPTFPSSASPTYHTTPTLLSAMNTALTSLTRETAEIRSKADETLREVKETVGGMSDLRYGRFAKGIEEEGGLEGEVERALGVLRGFLKGKGQGREGAMR